MIANLAIIGNGTNHNTGRTTAKDTNQGKKLISFVEFIQLLLNMKKIQEFSNSIIYVMFLLKLLNFFVVEIILDFVR